MDGAAAAAPDAAAAAAVGAAPGAAGAAGGAAGDAGAAAAAAAAAGDDTAYGYARSGRVRRMHPVLGEAEIEEGRYVLEVASHVCQHPDGMQRPPHCAPLLFGSQAGRGGAGWVLRRVGSDDELIRGFGRVSDWVQRSLSDPSHVSLMQ